MKKNNHIKQLRYLIEWLLLKSIQVVAPLIPRNLIVRISEQIGKLAFIFDTRGRITGEANVKCAIQSGQLTNVNPQNLILKSYQHFSRSAIDLFWGKRLNKKNYSKYIQIEFEDKKAHDEAIKNGAIWITPHYGSFEWISLAMGFLNVPFVVIAQDFRNPMLTNIFKKSREHSGHQIISSNRAVIKLMKTLRKKGHAALLTDLYVNPGKESVPIKCFSRITSVTRLHAFLHHQTKLPIIPGIAVPCSDGSYLMKVLKPIEYSPNLDEQKIAQKCWDVFEKKIRDFPEPWLWMYRYWRHKPQTSEFEEYPFYAKESEKFDNWINNPS